MKMKILLSLFLTLLACHEFTNGYRILGVFPLHGKSHWVMMEKLMVGLANRGHQVDVVTHFPRKTPLPNYRDISLAGSIEQATNKVTAKDVKGFSTLSLNYLSYIAGTKICDLLEWPELQKLMKNPPAYDLVIVELFVSPCYLAFGRYLNVPMIGTISSSFHDWLSDATGSQINPAFVPSLFSPFSSRMTFWQRLQNTLMMHIVNAQIHYHTNKQSEYVKKYFGLDVPIYDLYKDLDLVLVNSHHSLHGIRPSTPAIIDVAGVHINDTNEPLSPELQKWLDESKHGCVLFTFGSMVRIESFPQHMMEAFYKVFEQIAPVRVLMKVAQKEDLLPGLPKNVMISSWFPQLGILKHKNTKVFITHGGLMGTQESIYYGVPMIGIPLFGDQHTNIMNYVNKKIAVSLGSPQNVTVETLSYALNTVLNDETYSKNAKQLSRLFTDRPMSPLDTALYWIEYVAKHGDILQSPAIHLTWWQRNLLDVYAFLLLCVVIVLYVALLVLRLLRKLLFGAKACPKKDSKELASKKKK